MARTLPTVWGGRPLRNFSSNVCKCLFPPRAFYYLPMNWSIREYSFNDFTGNQSTQLPNVSTTVLWGGKPWPINICSKNMIFNLWEMSEIILKILRKTFPKNEKSPCVHGFLCVALKFPEFVCRSSGMWRWRNVHIGNVEHQISTKLYAQQIPRK